MQSFVRRARDFAIILFLVTVTTVAAYFIAASRPPAPRRAPPVDTEPVLLLDQPLPFDVAGGLDMRFGPFAELPSPEDAYVDRTDFAAHRVELRLRTASSATATVDAYAEWAEDRDWFVTRRLRSQTGAEFVARRDELELTVSAQQGKQPMAIRIAVSHPEEGIHPWLPYAPASWARGPLADVAGPAGDLINQTLHREVAEVWLRTPDTCSPGELFDRWRHGRSIRREEGAQTSEAEWDSGGTHLYRMIVHRTSTACDVWIRGIRKTGPPPWGVEDE